MRRVVFAISGQLGMRVFDQLRVHRSLEVVGIIVDTKSAEVFLTEPEGFSVFKGNPRGGSCRSWIHNEKLEFDFLISVNYLFLLEVDVINCAKIASINLHGSLLPKYRGRTPHVWAIINGETETGVTAHIIDEGCDTGPIVYQRIVPISPSDTGASILKLFERIYPDVVMKSISMLENTRFTPVLQEDGQASYFGKRSPIDGIIDWRKSSFELINWIRAQSNPYPGAFCMFRGKQLVIDKAERVTCCNELNGFGPGGFVWRKEHISVRTGDGFLRLVVVRGVIPQNQEADYFDGYQ